MQAIRHLGLISVLTLVAGSAFALYDPAPDAALAAAQGKWSGQLTYRDYSKPDRLVTLPTSMFVALGGPNALNFCFVFDDGPSKTVYSYERMSFDFAGRQLVWASGSPVPMEQTYKITSSTKQGDTTILEFEHQEDGETNHYTLSLAATRFEFTKEEIRPSGERTFRNRYLFTRAGD